MAVLKFLKSKLFLWQILLMIVAAFAILALVMWSLSFYTQHGQTIKVPSYVGFTERQIQNQVKNAGLEYVIIDSVYRLDARPGEIVDQIPSAGKDVKNGRKIFFTINAYNREMVEMPQLVDYSLRNAQVVLESKGLKLGTVTYSPSEYVDLVLGQYLDGKPIKRGEKVAKGSYIGLTVGSTATGQLSLVPELVGFNLRDALETIEKAGFVVGSLLYDDNIYSSADTATSVVYKQTPEPSNRLSEPAGSSINLWLTSDMEKVVEAMAALNAKSHE